MLSGLCIILNTSVKLALGIIRDVEENSFAFGKALIKRCGAFFEQMGVATRLSAYGLDAAVIPQVVAKLEEHQFVALGEHGDITPADVAKILELAL